MKGETIYISTIVGERLREILKIVGETLVGVESLDDEALVKISATEDQWDRIRTQLQVR